MEDYEVIMNLWYIMDAEGFVYSLRARPYIYKGSDEDKVNFLKKMALTDYLIAKPYPIPAKSNFIFDGHKEEMPVIHNGDIDIIGINTLFKDALNDIESNFPAQHDLSIPEEFLYVLTPLLANNEGEMWPVVIRKGEFIRL